MSNGNPQSGKIPILANASEQQQYELQMKAVIQAFVNNTSREVYVRELIRRNVLGDELMTDEESKKMQQDLRVIALRSHLAAVLLTEQLGMPVDDQINLPRVPKMAPG